jgi:hypothetical protein
MEKGKSMNKTAILTVIAAAGVGMVVPKAAKADDIQYFRFYRPVQTRIVRTVIIPSGTGGRLIYTNSPGRMIVVRRAPNAGTPARPYKSRSTAARRANRETGNETLSEVKAHSNADAKSQDLQPDVLQQFADQARKQETNPLPAVINN